MSLEDALVILGLCKGYTKDELNQAYKERIKKFHPDLYENKSDEIKNVVSGLSQELNEARNILLFYLNNNRENSNNKNYNELIRYKQPIIEDLKKVKYMIYDVIAFNDETFDFEHIKFQYKINDYITKIENANTITDVLMYKEEFKFDYISYKHEYVKAFYRFNNIPYDYMISTINFKISINDICVSLENIKSLYLINKKYSDRKMNVLYNACISSNNNELITLYKGYCRFKDISLENKVKELLFKSSLKEVILYLEVLDKFSSHLDDNELMEKVNYIFDLYDSGLIDIDKILLLNSISFSNKELDNYKLDLILDSVKDNNKTRIK